MYPAARPDKAATAEAGGSQRASYPGSQHRRNGKQTRQTCLQCEEIGGELVRHFNPKDPEGIDVGYDAVPLP